MDRISGLPEELICHILSFLTTKEAALTSILSSRWRDLLAFVPYLYIDDSVFLHPEEGKHNREDIIQSFENFVDRVFALQGDSPIKKLSLKCLIKVGSVRVDGWISNVLTRGVSELDLDISLNSDDNDDDNDDDTYRLSPECFECSTLVKLKIECVIDIGWVTGRIFLPMLKSLHLYVVQICSDEFKVLLDSLPVLEDLVLDDVLWQNQDVIVSSSSLKTLKIKLYDSLSSLSFDTPSVVYFWYSGYIASDYPLVNMKNLVDAQFYFAIIDRALELARGPVNVWLENVDEDEVALGFSNVWKLFHGVKNVPYLDLSATTLEVLSLCCESMPVFKNLKSLAIMSRKDQGWQAMPVLLSNCPNLETLVIEGLVHHVTEKCGDACECISKEDKGSSLKLCPVKVLEIQGFRGTMKEMSMIKHFLDHFPCLKEMEIYVAEDGPTLLGNREVSKHITELFELYNQLSSCNVQLLVSDALSKKWRKNKTIS